MRKTAKIISILMIFSILFTGCGKTNNIETAFDEKAIYTIAEETVESLRDGKFDTVVSQFDEKVSKKIDATTLKTAWDGVVSSLGNYIGLGSIEGNLKGDHYVCTIIENYEENGLKVTITYDSNMQISGLNLNYAPIVSEPLVNEAFTEEKVTVAFDETMPLEGLLTLPKNVEQPPVVLLVQGSGPSDKNEAIFSNTPFMDIAHALAEKGIASLRYDKRYFSYPEKAEALGSELTLREEVLDDVSAAIALLSQDKRVDSSNIYVLGHSLGGMLTPAIAIENNEVKGIISVAGTLRPLYEVSYDQNKALEKQLLANDLDKDTLAALKLQIQQVEKDIEVLRGDISEIPNEVILMGISAGYQKSVKEYAGSQFIDQIKIPILVLQGKADFQVSVDKDFASWTEMIGDRSNATLKCYDNLNHLMMETNGKEDVSEYQVKGTVNKEVIDDIASFIQSNS